MSSKAIALTLAVFVSWTASMQGQTRGSLPSTTTPNPPGASLKLIGCVERADQLTPTGSAVGATVDSLDFVLMKAERVGSAQSADGASSGTPSGAQPGRPTSEQTPTGTAGRSSTTAGPGNLYRLTTDTVKLNPHVGHRVEVSGTLMSASDPASTARAPQPSDPSPASAPIFKVDTVRMISETCGRK